MARKILFVDDEEDLRRIVVRLLRPLGEVIEAGDGTEALRLVELRAPDVMLLDVGLPDMSGLDVLKAARERRPDLPVLVLTGKLELDTARAVLKHGARAYVTKPFEPDVLMREVVRLLNGSVDADDGRPWRVRGPGP